MPPMPPHLRPGRDTAVSRRRARLLRGGRYGGEELATAGGEGEEGAGEGAWGRWRRSGSGSIYASDCPTSSSSSSSEGADDPPKKDCWNTCDYPSECRWGRQFGVHTPLEPRALTLPLLPTPPPPPPSPPLQTSPAEGILNPETTHDKAKKGTTNLWDALVASATRRKSVPPASPLSTIAEGADDAPARDGDGDVVMGASTSLPIVTPREIIRKSAKRTRTMSSGELTGSEEESVSTEAYARALDELPRLERVKSRDSGYESMPEMGGLGWGV
ncbi:hypothetical protein P171DRAFT_472517 [Karstenula rhodostoma CBS 690.94]|uniref:Uncharacterized protein n=1 Tax=Karstenula rhodostoma CBS 690.94 TaxID=1392251 RepID=A0A9P4PKS2_9PLEO|nr:hypothetical protein P171DRAFT_472517 [Karstenula rhodostoma CBS 690.94]